MHKWTLLCRQDGDNAESRRWLVACLSADVWESRFGMWKMGYGWQYMMYGSAGCMKVKDCLYIEYWNQSEAQN